MLALFLDTSFYHLPAFITVFLNPVSNNVSNAPSINGYKNQLNLTQLICFDGSNWKRCCFWQADAFRTK